MVLSDQQILEMGFIKPMAQGVFGKPIPGVISYGPTSYGYDARISKENIKVFSPINAKEIDPKNFDPYTLVTPTFYMETNIKNPQLSHTYFHIPPHGFALCGTLEEFHIPREYVCLVVGKSTYARCGLIVNVTPGEPEWIGKWTVELSNTTSLPIRVYLDEGIMQCLFLRGERTCKVSYADKKGKYQNQSGMTPPKVIVLQNEEQLKEFDLGGEG